MAVLTGYYESILGRHRGVFVFHCCNVCHWIEVACSLLYLRRVMSIPSHSAFTCRHFILFLRHILLFFTISHLIEDNFGFYIVLTFVAVCIDSWFGCGSPRVACRFSRTWFCKYFYNEYSNTRTTKIATLYTRSLNRYFPLINQIIYWYLF